jgi:hypothetical protein
MQPEELIRLARKHRRTAVQILAFLFDLRMNSFCIRSSTFRVPTENQLRLARNASKRKLQLGAYVSEWNEASVARCPGTVA